MKRLSKSIDAMQSHYEIVVVGSGYGGSIAASRLSRAGREVCLLERGREILPGEYPDYEPDAAGEMQVDLPGRRFGPDTGLYDFRVNDEINVFLGCGLGGTSLVNANVALPPSDWVLEDPSWPESFRRDENLWEECIHHAMQMLRPAEYPAGGNTPDKLTALQQGAQAVGEEYFRRTPVNVTFEDGVNHVGVEQQACTDCGDCVTGCNYGSKNTTLMNYLPDAVNHGASVFTEVAVQRLARIDNQWQVFYILPGRGRERFDTDGLFLTTDIVVLAAGTLGTTEILLRSRQHGLELSDQVGQSFTGNGDFLGFGYNNDVRVNGIGRGHLEPDPDDPVGPTITGVIDLRDNKRNPEEGMVVEEGVIPGALSAIMVPVLEFASKTMGIDTDSGLGDWLRETWRRIRSWFGGAYHGSASNTSTYLVMTHDDRNGRMYLEDDRLRISWPDAGEQSIFQRVNRTLKKITGALGGTYISNPTWNKHFKHRLTTVHPLGGCSMAETAKEGVVNHKGQVFSEPAGNAVYDNLYVADGSVMPRSLGVNPLLSISAIAERTCSYMALDRGWDITYDFPEIRTEETAAPVPGLEFTERMTGFWSRGNPKDYQEAYEQGESEGSPLSFTLTILSDDIKQMLEDPDHEAGIIGTVKAPALSDSSLTVRDGRFHLFVRDPEAVDTYRMEYHMNLHSEEGDEYYFRGFKRIHDDPGPDMWEDTTTLYVTIYEGNSPDGISLGKGILKIRPKDFTKQLRTIKVPNAGSISERLRYTARFGEFFGSTVFNVYGDAAAGQWYFNPDAAPRKQRPLRAGVPELFPVETNDGFQIRLTRYQGGSKGPVILSHGLGVSSRIFSTDTIDTNLLEFLYRHEYDVWLLDYRASTELAAAHRQSSADDIARYDYPAAVRNVRDVTGANSVQMVVHCYGATTWTMSVLGGWLQGVRSAVCSQVSTHMEVPLATKLKTGLHVPELLDKLGIDSLTAYVDENSEWEQKLLDDALQFFPKEDEEECNNPVCHRITFLYGHLYEHDQLNSATHTHLHELFGVANMEAFEHLALMSRRGHILSADGSDTYLPNLDKMAFPVLFISGAENQCFLPDSTARTVDALRRWNDPALYDRKLIPGYGHIDCIFGKNASRDVFPQILSHLERTNE